MAKILCAMTGASYWTLKDADRNLITGQNPASSGPLALELVKALSS
ncbi:hypothetical protein ACWDFR_31195 [Streptomyces sp. 900105755]